MKTRRPAPALPILLLTMSSKRTGNLSWVTLTRTQAKVNDNILVQGFVSNYGIGYFNPTRVILVNPWTLTVGSGRSSQSPESPKGQVLLAELRPISKLLPSLGEMLRVFQPSGGEVFAAGFEEFVAMTPESERPDKARALKCHVQRVSGHSRFRQGLLLLDGHVLSDDFVFRGPTDVQLILQQFEASSEEQIRQLREAADGNDIQAMEQLLQRPQDPDLEVGGMPPALHCACGQGYANAARLLLEANADKDKASFDSYGSTPMQWACDGGHVEVVQLLLEASADKDKAAETGATPLMFASQHGHLEIARLLLEANADKDNRAAADGATPLIVASQNGRSEVVRLLLEANADKDQAKTDGRTSLFMASATGRLEVAQLLLEANADNNKAENDGSTPLWVASQNGHLEVARLLLEANADKEKARTDGRTALFMASATGHLEVAQLLLEANVDKDKSADGATPLWVASLNGHLEVARLLLESIADRDKARNNGSTPLWAASQNGHFEVARLLLEANADRDKAAKDGTTPLNMASQNGHLEVARLLLEANAGKDSKNSRTIPVFMSNCTT